MRTVKNGINPAVLTVLYNKIDKWEVIMKRTIIGYDPNAGIEYKINKNEYEIISSHPVRSYYMSEKINKYNKPVLESSEAGFLSDERIDKITKMVLSL